MKNSRCAVLALALTLISILYYGYYSYSNCDYFYYCLPAVSQLHPQNFANDAFVQSMGDYHPVFTFILNFLYKNNIEIISVFILFVLAKFFIYFSILLLARKVIHEKWLVFFSLIFLFTFVSFGLANSTLTANFPCLVPRMMGWGLFLAGFNVFISKKYIATSVLWGLATLIHIHFIFLAFPMLCAGLIFFSIKEKFFARLYPLVIFLCFAIPVLIFIAFHSPFRGTISNQEYIYYFLQNLGSSNYWPHFYLYYRGDIFLLLCLPLVLYWKKIVVDAEIKKMWLLCIIFITTGTIFSIVTTEFFFNRYVLFMWFPGFTPFITLTSIVFYIGYITNRWDISTANNIPKKILDALFLYSFVFVPYLLLLQFIIQYIFFNKKNNIKKIFFSFIFVLLFFIIAPWGFGYINHYYVKPWSGINFTMPEVIYFIKNYTPNDTMFMVPPSVWYIQPYANRSVVADYSHYGLGGYLKEWKKRMDDITGIDIFQKEKKDLNYLYATRSLEDITNLIKKYNANYYMTFNYENIKKKFEMEKNFKLVYWDNEFLIYQIAGSIVRQ